MRKIVLSLIVMLIAVFSAKALVYTVVVPEGTKACYIAGSMTDWGHEQMEQDPDEPTIFTIDIDEATAADKYKYCCGPGWAWVEKNAEGGEISDRNYQEIDFVETWALEYDPDLGDVEFTLNVTVPEETKAVYVKGSYNGWSGYEPMEQVTETTYTLTVTATGTAAIKYQYASGPDDKYLELDEEGEMVGDRLLSDLESDDVVIAWKAVYDPDEIIEETEFILTVTVPEGTKACYVAGSMNDWIPEPMEKVAEPSASIMKAAGVDTYTITFTVRSNEIEYKYLSGPDWKYEELQADGTGLPDNRILAASDSPVVDVVELWKEVYAPTGLNNLKVDDVLLVASKAAITVQFTGNATVEIYTVQGVLLKKTVATGTFNYAGLPVGIYIVKINNNTYKVLVK